MAADIIEGGATGVNALDDREPLSVGGCGKGPNSSRPWWPASRAMSPEENIGLKYIREYGYHLPPGVVGLIKLLPNRVQGKFGSTVDSSLGSCISPSTYGNLNTGGGGGALSFGNSGPTYCSGWAERGSCGTIPTGVWGGPPGCDGGNWLGGTLGNMWGGTGGGPLESNWFPK